MKTMNRVSLMGFLGANPEMQLSKSGKTYSRLRLATHRGQLTAEGKWETRTDWHSVFVWGPLAERCCHSMHKGDFVWVEGPLTYWPVAIKDYKNAIHATEVSLLRSAKVAVEAQPQVQDLDNSPTSRNHNAVAHPA